MKKTVILFLTALVTSSGAIHAQKFYWAHSAESQSNSNDIRAIEVTSDGHTIAFGTFNNLLHLGDFELEEDDNGTSYFLAKLDESGDAVWVKSIQSDEYFSVTHNQVGLTIDDSDNIYISAVYKGNLQLETTTLTNSEATSDYFVAKYDTNGDLGYAWGQGADDAIAVSIAVDASNNVYVSGYYTGDLSFNDTEETVLTSSGSYDAFIAKYNDEGIAQWARSSGNADNYDTSYGVEVNGTSIYWGVNYRVGTTSKQYFMSVLKLDADNELQWTYEAGSTDSGSGYINQANRLKAYGSDIYVVGYFRGGIQPDGEDVPLTHSDYQSLTFKVKDLGASASYQWATAVGDDSYDYGYAIARQGSSLFSSRYTYPNAFIDELSDVDGSVTRSTTSGSPGSNDREYIYDIEAYAANQIRFGGYFDENIYYGENGHWTSESINLFLCQSDLLIEPDWLVGSYAFSISYRKSILDESGNTYVGGTFSGVMRDGDEVTKSRGSRDILVEKFDPFGNLLFRKIAGSPLNDYFGDIALHNNELHLTAVFDVGDGDKLLYIEGQTLAGDEDQEVFLARYEESGDLDLVVLAASTEGDLLVNSIGLDKDGNIYLYGDARGGSPKSFGNGVSMAYDEQGFFLTKYNSSAVAQWVQSVNDTDDFEMHVSAEDGIFVSGKYSIEDLNFEGTILPSEGFEDIFFAKYDYNGDFEWVVGGGGPSTDAISGITSDPDDGSVYLTGYFHNSLTLSGHTVSGTNRELFTAKYDHLGAYEWLVSGGGNRTKDQGKAIALDTAGHVIVVGQYEGDDATFDDYTPGGAGEYEVEALLLKYNPDNGDLLEGHHWGVPTNYEEGDDNEYFGSLFIDENNDLSITGQFVDEVMLDTIAVPIYHYYSSFVTKMSLSDCAHIGTVDFSHAGTMNAKQTIAFTDLTDLGAHELNSWAWEFGDGSTDDEQHPSHVYDAEGNYDVTLTVTYNTSCTLEWSQSIVIAEKLNTAPIVSNPMDDVTLEEGFLSKILDLTNVFEDEDEDALTYTYSSSDESVIKISVKNQELTLTEIGPGSATITVEADDENGGKTSDQFSVTVNPYILGGVSNIKIGIRVYPNPTTGLIQLESVFQKITAIHILDLSGQLIASHPGASSVISLQSLESGTYLLNIIAQDNQYFRRVIKH